MAEESNMRKIYTAPVLRTQKLELGVFGDYGQYPPAPPRGGIVNPMG